MALTSICSWSRKAEGETSVSNCCMKYKVQRGQVHYGNSEEGEFISTRGNLGRLPEEGGLDQVFFGNSGTYTWEGREMCCQRSTWAGPKANIIVPGICQQNMQNRYCMYSTQLVISNYMFSHLLTFTYALPSVWNILPHLHFHFRIQERYFLVIFHVSA